MAKQANQKTTQQSQSKAVGFLAANAMSADVGKKAVEDFGLAERDDVKIAELKQENTSRKGATLKALTLAFIKAASADKNVKLGDCQSDVEKDSRDLKQKLEVAVGIRIATAQGDGSYKVEYADWAKDKFPQPGEDKKTEEGRIKENFRTNFSAVFKKAMAAAHAIQLRGITAQEDKKSGALMITGKAVKERFGVDNVLLNEKREYKEGDRKVTLNKIPSFTELGRISAEAVGKIHKTKTDSRPKTSALTENELVPLVKNMQKALESLKNFGDELATALEGLQDTIEKVLSDNEGTEAA